MLSLSGKGGGFLSLVSGEAFPQCLKLLVRANDLSQALAIENCFKALAYVSENECDSVPLQIAVQFFEGSGRVVHARDRSPRPRQASARGKEDLVASSDKKEGHVDKKEGQVEIIRSSTRIIITIFLLVVLS
jgi:hypothetical protein